MKVISLYEPYATLMALGLKTNETRSWDTQYRGPLLIHATKAMPAWCKELFNEVPFIRALAGVSLSPGCIVGMVEVVGTTRTELVANIEQSEFYETDEYWFGDYSPGRFAWQTINPVRFATPIPAKGSQGFWNFDSSTIPELMP